MTASIPDEKSAAVARAFRDCFGVSEWDDLEPLTRGESSALVYRAAVAGRLYLLRIIMREEDPTRHFRCMEAAAEAGIAPRVLYASVEDRVCITDFIEARLFPVDQALVRLPALLRRLHALPPFPAAPFNTTCTFLLDRGPAVEDLVRKVRRSNALPADELDELVELSQRAAAAYTPRANDRVSCHNDLFKSDNTLFDGERAWLVDWEAACLNDRYADLAVVANYLVHDDAQETVYLEAYFGQPPSTEQRDRFRRMRRVVHAFYAMVYLWLGSLAGPVDPGEPAPELDEMHRRIWSGELHLGDDPAKTLYGRAHWSRLRQATGNE
ncbi:MAG: phosphotransferase [Bryobacterales bacterium]|nr:phosphotransferase [Bryobacterales bacterium]